MPHSPRWSCWWLLVLSAVIHCLLVEQSVWLTGKNALRFTDVDYSVFVGGQVASLGQAAGLEAGQIHPYSSFMTDATPYRRTTYRYSPVMGMLTLPNLILNNDAAAKYLFGAFNVLAAYGIKKILDLYKVNRQVGTILVAAFALNPVVIHVAARGNSDSVMSALTIMALYLYLRKWYTSSALILGVATHVKMYPILFIVPMTLAMNPETNVVVVLRALARPVSPAITKIQNLPTGRNGISHRALESLKLAAYITFIPFMFVYEFVFRRMTKAQWLYATTALGSAIGLTYAVYKIYGWSAVYEGFLYHLVRHDHRHNMSIISLWATLATPRRFYELALPWYGSPAIYKILLTLTNKVLVMLAGAALAHVSVPLALFMQIIIFVAFNGVITVQYFVWHGSLLPVALATAPKFRALVRSGTWRDTLNAMKPLLFGWLPLFTMSILAWVRLSYQFESRGWLPAFYLMFLTDAALLISHVGMACYLL